MARIKNIFLMWIVLGILLSVCPYSIAYQDKAQELADVIAQKKRIEEQEKNMLVEGHMVKGMVLYKEGEYCKALDEFLLAQKIDPYNKEAADYIDRCKKQVDNLANKHYLKGIKFYKNGNLLEAADEFILIPEESSQYKEAQAYLVKIEEELNSLDEKEALARLEAERKKLKEREAEKLTYKGAKKEITQQLKDIKEQLAIAELRKKAQEESMMLDVEKAYLPVSRVREKEETEEETREEKKEREEIEARAKVIEQMNSISVPALSLNDADIRDVIRQLMNMTGVTIVLDEVALAKVAGEGTIRLTFTTVNPMPLLNLLELSLKATGLNYRVEPSYIWISDRETLTKEELVTKTYKLKYGVRKIREVSLTEFGRGEAEEEY